MADWDDIYKGKGGPQQLGRVQDFPDPRGEIRKDPMSPYHSRFEAEAQQSIADLRREVRDLRAVNAALAERVDHIASEGVAGLKLRVDALESALAQQADDSRAAHQIDLRRRVETLEAARSVADHPTNIGLRLQALESAPAVASDPSIGPRVEALEGQMQAVERHQEGDSENHLNRILKLERQMQERIEASGTIAGMVGRLSGTQSNQGERLDLLEEWLPKQHERNDGLSSSLSNVRQRVTALEEARMDPAIHQGAHDDLWNRATALENAQAGYSAEVNGLAGRVLDLEGHHKRDQRRRRREGGMTTYEDRQLADLAVRVTEIEEHLTAPQRDVMRARAVDGVMVAGADAPPPDGTGDLRDKSLMRRRLTDIHNLASAAIRFTDGGDKSGARNRMESVREELERLRYDFS